MPEYKCMKCQTTQYGEDVSRVAEHDEPAHLVCGYCGSDELVECDLAWAIRELEELRKGLQGLVLRQSEPLTAKLLEIAATNAAQVKEFLEEM